MAESLNFAVLDEFLDFAKDISGKDGLNRSAFKTANGSFLSLVMEEHQDASRALKKIGTLCSTLIKLARLVEEGLSSAREELLPSIYNQGFYTLPFEIVGRIFELVYDGRRSYEWRNILSVNRYFHDMALSMPKLWTEVNNAQDPSIFLERSRSQGLNISIEGFNQMRRNIFIYMRRTERFLNLLGPHSYRWKSLTIRRSHTDGGSIDDFRICHNIVLRSLRDYFKGRLFPALENLQVDYGLDTPRDIELDGMPDNERDPYASIRSFFSTWDMPALRRFDVRGFIPILPSACMSNLTCFHLMLNGNDGSDVWDLGIIIQFLHSLPALTDLSIALYMIDGFRNGEGNSTPLPNIEKLSFEIISSEIEAMQRLLDTLSSSSVKELSLIIETWTSTTTLEALFPKSAPRWPHLETLACYIEVDHEKCRVSPLDILCKRLPRLHHLTIETASLEQPTDLRRHRRCWEPGERCHPPLRTLRLVRCKKFDTSFIFKLSNVICAVEFEMIEIRNCPRINAEVVRKLIPAGKELKCTEYDWSRQITAFK